MSRKSKRSMIREARGQQDASLRIDQIRTDGGTQPRTALDLDVVEEYAGNLDASASKQRDRMVDKNGFPFAPVVVYYDGEDHWIVDGFHRLNAAKERGLERVEANVLQGTLRDARLHSYGVNADHGKRRTNEDKIRAVDAMLRDEEWVGWSNRKIAKACRVSHTMVNDRRTLLERALEIAAQEERVGSDGVVQRAGSKAKSKAAKVESASTSIAAPLLRRDGVTVQLEATPTPQVLEESAPGKEHGGGTPTLPEQTDEVTTTEHLRSDSEKIEKWGVDVFEPTALKDWYQVSERLEEAHWVVTPWPEIDDLVAAMLYQHNAGLKARAYVDVGETRYLIWGEGSLPSLEAGYGDMGGLERALGVEG